MNKLIAILLITLLASCAVTKPESWIVKYQVTHVQKTARGYEVYVKAGRELQMTVMPVLPDSVKAGTYLSFYRFIKVKS